MEWAVADRQESDLSAFGCHNIDGVGTLGRTRLGSGRRVGQLSDEAHGIDRFNGARDDLASPESMRVVGETVLEELGVREDDAKLIVQLMEQAGEVGRRWKRVGTIGCTHQAPLESGSSVHDGG